jgi:hypothetical protein
VQTRPHGAVQPGSVRCVFEVDFEIEDGMPEPFAYPVLADGGRGPGGGGSQAVAVAAWEDLAARLWVSAAEGQVLSADVRARMVSPPS